MQRKTIWLFAILIWTQVTIAQQTTVDSIQHVQQLEEIMITSIRLGSNDNVLNADHISAKELSMQNTSVNLPFLLTATPSLVVTSDDGLGVGYTYFRVRGTDHTRINMTVNGIPFNDSESQTVFWVNMTDMASSLSDVVVQRGVGTSTNGAAAFGASINMKTMFATPEPFAQIDFDGGMYGTFRESIKIGTGMMPKGFAFDARFSKVDSKGYLERAFSDLYSYSASGGYYGEKTMVKLIMFGGSEKTYMAWDGVDEETLKKNRRYNPAGKYIDDAGNEAFYENQTDNYKQYHTHLHLSHLINPTWNISAALHYTKGNGYYEQYKPNSKFSNYALNNYVDNNGEIVKTSDLVRQKHLDNHFYGGVASVNYNTKKIQAAFGGAINQYLGQHFGRVIWLRNYLLPVEKDHTYYDNHGDKLDANIYLKANWNISNRLAAYGDIQYRYVDYAINGINDEELTHTNIHRVFNFFNPKAGITYQHKAHTAYVTFAIANREPSRSNYMESGINEHPIAERLYDYEAGYNFQNQCFNIGFNAYFMNYDNQLVLTGQYSDIGAYLTKNVKDSYRIGIEMVGGIQISKWLHWNGNITISRNKIVNFTDWVDDWSADWSDPQVAAQGGQVEVSYGTTDISFSPNLTAGSIFLANIKGFKTSLQTNFIGKQYLDNTMNSASQLKSYSVSNLYLSYTFPIQKPFKELTLKAQINNLFNTMYVSNGGAYSYFETTDSSGNYSPKDQKYIPWYYAQAGINLHIGFNLLF